MVKIYVRAIIDGRKTIEGVPKRWRSEVEAELEKLKENSTDENGTE